MACIDKPSQESFESQHSQLPPGPGQTMYLPPLLLSSQQTQPQQPSSQQSASPSPASTPNDETKAILIPTPSPGPGQPPYVSPMPLPPVLPSQELSLSQPNICSSPTSMPDDETRPVLIQMPTPGPDKTPSISPMGLETLLPSQETQRELVLSQANISPSSASTPNDETKPVPIQTPSPGFGQPPFVSPMDLAPSLPSFEQTQPQQSPLQSQPVISSTLASPNDETKQISIEISSLGPGQAPYFSPMHIPPLLPPSSQQTQSELSLAQQNISPSPTSMPDDVITPILIQTPSLGPGQTQSVSPVNLLPSSVQTQPELSLSQSNLSPPPASKPNDEIKQIFIQTPSLGPDQTPSVPPMHLPTLPSTPQTEPQAPHQYPSPMPASTSNDEKKPIKKKRKINKRNYHRNFDDLELTTSTDKVLSYLKIKKQKKTTWDSVEYLFMSYAKSFKQLSLRKQVKIKVALEKLFDDAEQDEAVNKSMNLCRELDSQEDVFFEYFHMSRDSFEELHYLLRPHIQKMDTNYRKAIGSRERLAVCLRYIRTGNSFITIAYSFRIGRSTVSMIVDAVSKAIWECLQPVYMPSPTEATWEQSEAGYQEIWNFPNCVGSIGGKHINIDCPRNNGSIVLFAVVDPFHKFIVIDVGCYGHPSDSNIFDNSAFYNQYLYNKKLLPPKPLPGTDEPVPHVLVGDEVFPLQTCLMRPYPPAACVHDPRKQRYNSRLAHARSVVENTFSILEEQWRVFQRPLECHLEKAVHVTKAACCLHNFVRTKHGDMMRTFSNETTPIEYSGTRSKKMRINAFVPLRPTNVRSPNAALVVREKFLEYFNRDHE